MILKLIGGVWRFSLVAWVCAVAPCWSQTTGVDDAARAEEYLRRGEAYQQGLGVAQDDLQAASWYRQAAALGNVKAMGLLAELYWHGKGYEEDRYHQTQRELAGLLHVLSEVGYPQADLFLGVLYQQGRGVRKDLEESAARYRRAMDAGIEDAAVELERLQRDLETYRTARRQAEEINLRSIGTRPRGGSGVVDEELSPRLVVQLGHAEPIVAVAFSPDAELAATAGQDDVIVLWHIRTGREIRRLVGVQARSIEFSPDGRFLLAGGQDGSARLWRVRTGEEVRRLVAHHDVVTSVEFLPDGMTAVTGSFDGTAVLWDLLDARPLLWFEAHSVLAAVVSDDGAILVTGGWDRTARIWSLATGESLGVLAGHGGEVEYVSVHPVTGSILTGGPDDPLRRWDPVTGSEIGWPSGGAQVGGNPTALSPSGRLVATGNGPVATVWNLQTGEVLHTLQGHFERVTALAFSPDEARILTGGVDSTARLWDLDDGREILRLEARSAAVTTVEFSPAGDRILAGDTDGFARIWNLDGGRQAMSLGPHRDRLRVGRFHPTGRVVLTQGGTFDTIFRTWNLDTSTYEEVSTQYRVSTVAYTPDGEHMVIGGDDLDPVIRILDPETLAEIQRFEGHGDTIATLSFSADGYTLASGSYYIEDSARLWDVRSGSLLREFPERLYGGMVTLSPDGRWLLTGSLMHSHFTSLWDTQDGRLVAQLAGQFDEPAGAAFSPDSRHVVTTGPDEIARIWEAATGTEVRQLRGHSARVTSVDYSPDGRLIVTGSDEGTVKLWEAFSGRLLVSLVSFREGTWAVLAPDGRFDSNNLESIEGLHWVLPEDPLTPLPVEIFLRDYYEPRLLPRILAGETFAPVPDLSELNRVQPTVAITAVLPDPARRDRVAVTVEVANVVRRSAGSADSKPLESGVYDLRLFRDGQLVGYRPRDDGAVTVDSLTGTARFVFPDLQLPRDGREKVTFTAHAFNRDRVKSATARWQHEVPRDLPRRQGRAFVVTTGVNVYQSPAWNLRYAAADARLFARALEQRLRGSGEFDEVLVIPLVSDYPGGVDAEQAPEAPATKANVLAVLQHLAGHGIDPSAGLRSRLASVPTVEPEDLVLLTFSGHGWVDAAGEFYFFPQDIGEAAERQVTPELLGRAISTEELSRSLRDLDAGNLVLIVDACHSAATVAREGFKPGPMGSRGLGQLAYDKGMRILSASQADSFALESDLTRQGLLTYALVRNGLEAGQADFSPEDRQITMEEWLRFATSRVPELYEEIRRGQLEPVAESVESRGVAPIAPAPPLQQPSFFDFTRQLRPLVLDTRD